MSAARIIRTTVFGLAASIVAMSAAAQTTSDLTLSAEQRAAILVSKMTLQEKAAQVGHTAPAIPRFGVPQYIGNGFLHNPENLYRMLFF